MSEFNKCIDCDYAKFVEFEDETNGKACELMTDSINTTYGLKVDCGLAAYGIASTLNRHKLIKTSRFNFVSAVGDEIQGMSTDEAEQVTTPSQEL